MTPIKTLSVIAVFSIAIAAPVFARDTGPEGHDHLRIHHRAAHHHVEDQHFRGAYNLHNERFYPSLPFQRNTENFGARGRDPSRIGGEDPNMHPSAY
jgi:hypothetical protein